MAIGPDLKSLAVNCDAVLDLVLVSNEDVLEELVIGNNFGSSDLEFI